MMGRGKGSDVGGGGRKGKINKICRIFGNNLWVCGFKIGGEG